MKGDGGKSGWRDKEARKPLHLGRTSLGRQQSARILQVAYGFASIRTILGTFSPWRKAWQPTPVFLSRESCGQRSLVGYSPWGCTELDTTEVT